MYVVIDRECIDGAEDEVVISTGSKEILRVLYTNYWDLDEIYIIDVNWNYLICVNHVFDIYFVGESLCNFFEKVNKISSINKYIIKEYD